MSKTDSLKPISEILAGFDWQKEKYISREFQDYGYRLAESLNDLPHKSLYIKLAKETPRELLEEAKNFVKDARADSPGRLFMWKLGVLKKAYAEKHPKK